MWAWLNTTATLPLRLSLQVMLVLLESAPGGLRLLARHSAALAAALLRLLERAALPAAVLPPAGREPGVALLRSHTPARLLHCFQGSCREKAGLPKLGPGA